MKQANTNTSLRTYTCTSYFPEYNNAVCPKNCITLKMFILFNIIQLPLPYFVSFDGKKSKEPLKISLNLEL